MNSCAASCCTCSPKVSCASATLVSSPTAGALCCCRFVFTHSVQHSNLRPTKTLLAPTISGAAPCVADRWWSWKGSPLQKSNSVLHLRSPLQHETTFSNSHPSRVSTCCVPLRLASQQISLSNLFSVVSAILFLVRQLPKSSAVLYRTALAIFKTVVSSHSISIGPASAATTGGFLLTA